MTDNIELCEVAAIQPCHSPPRVLYVLMASVVAVYAPELFATKVRFRCVGFANAVAKLLNVLMPMVVGWMLTSLGATSIFVAISAIAIASMLIVGFFGAETAQKSVG